MGRMKWMKAFCRLLGFELMPRIRRIGEQRLYLPHSAQRQDYPNLQLVLTLIDGLGTD
jgi:TnpA family transposase